MKDKAIIQWAIKGLAAEIDNLEKTVNQGKQFLLQYEQGQKPKTPKTPFEIKAIIQEKKAEIEKLHKMKSDLQWQIELEGADEK